MRAAQSFPAPGRRAACNDPHDMVRSAEIPAGGSFDVSSAHLGGPGAFPGTHLRRPERSRSWRSPSRGAFGPRSSCLSVVAVACALGVTAASVSAAAPVYTGWSAPVNLGPVVNSAASESGPALSADGLSLYFSASRRRQRHLGVTTSDYERAMGRACKRGAGQLDRDGLRAVVVCGQSLDVLRKHPYRRLRRRRSLPVLPRKHPRRLRLADADQPRRRTSTPQRPRTETAPSITEATHSCSSEATGWAPPGAPTCTSPISKQTARGAPPSLIPELSSSGTDNRPNLRSDGLEIFFYSDRTGSLGSTDIWTSTRATVTAPWSDADQPRPERQQQRLRSSPLAVVGRADAHLLLGPNGRVRALRSVHDDPCRPAHGDREQSGQAVRPGEPAADLHDQRLRRRRDLRGRLRHRRVQRRPRRRRARLGHTRSRAPRARSARRVTRSRRSSPAHSRSATRVRA